MLYGFVLGFIGEMWVLVDALNILLYLVTLLIIVVGNVFRCI